MTGSQLYRFKSAPEAYKQFNEEDDMMFKIHIGSLAGRQRLELLGYPEIGGKDIGMSPIEGMSVAYVDRQEQEGPTYNAVVVAIHEESALMELRKRASNRASFFAQKFMKQDSGFMKQFRQNLPNTMEPGIVTV